MEFFGYGCCRYEGDVHYKYHQYKTIKDCLKICENNDNCIAADVANPNTEKVRKYKCYTWEGSGKFFRTECGTENVDEMCYKKPGKDVNFVSCSLK